MPPISKRAILRRIAPILYQIRHWICSYYTFMRRKTGDFYGMKRNNAEVY